MLRDINLKVHPSTSGSVKWSADGQLCMPFGDRVNILANTCFNPQNVHPKMIFNNDSNADEDGEYDLEDEEDEPIDNESVASDKSDEDDDDLDVVSFDSQFHLTTIDINIVPELGVELLDNEELNLGETTRQNEIIKLVWSPLGVGSYGRCVLCVLLSSCQLIFYEPQTVIGGDWKAVHDLCENFATTFWHDHRAQRRVKDLSWSQSCHLAGFNWGVAVLAVATFADEIHLAYTRYGKVRILTSCPIKSESFVLKGLSNLCWSPWTNVSDNSGQSLLTYSFGSKLYVRQVTLRVSGQEVAATMSDAIEVSKPLTASHSLPGVAWYDKKLNCPSHGNGLILVAVFQTQVELYFVELRENEPLRVSLLAHTSPEIVDHINGMNIVRSDSGSHLLLNITTDNGRLIAIAYDVANNVMYVSKRSVMPSLDEDIISTDNEERDEENLDEEYGWLERVVIQQEAFAKKDNIAKVFCKAFGMDVFPFSAFLVISYRRKPEGFVEYLTKDRGEATNLSFGNIRTCRTLLKNNEDVLYCSTEALIAATEWLSNDESDSTTLDMLDNVSTDKLELPIYDQDSTQEEDIRLYLYKAFHQPHLIKLRLRHSLSFLSDRKLLKMYTSYQDQRSVLKFMNALVLGIPFHDGSLEHVQVIESGLSSTIRYLHILLGINGLYADQQIFDLACKQLDQFFQYHDQPTEEEYQIINSRRRALMHGTIYQGPTSVTEKVYEVCSCCEAPIVFNDFLVAQCVEGHRYRRCGLTYIALQDPHSRVCGICTREYISKEAVEEDANLALSSFQNTDENISIVVDDSETLNDVDSDQMEFDESKETDKKIQNRTLAQILVGAVEVCVYCGGHLYDKAARFGSGPENSGGIPV